MAQFPALTNRIPLRVRLVALVGIALTVSLGAFLLASSAAFYDDKASYILDYNLAEVRAVATQFESQVRRVVLLTQMAGAEGGHERLTKILEESAVRDGLQKLSFFEINSDGEMKERESAGSAETVSPASMGWDGFEFLKGQIMVSRAPHGLIAVGSLHTIAGPTPLKLVAIALIQPKFGGTEAASGFQFFVADQAGDLLISSSKKVSVNEARWKSLGRDIGRASFSSGGRRWSRGSENDLVAYQKLGIEGLTVIGVLPEKVAFSAISHLILRSVLLGLSILLVVAGLTLLFVKRMTQGLQLIAQVTDQVSKGGFSFRVDTRSMKNDEIGSLASSFNSMADKIDELMNLVVVKVETETRQEQSQVVHGNLFPKGAFQHSNLGIMGASIFANEVSGDWWHYDQIGEYVVVMVGKVEGKGLTAAMLTAVARGAASTFVATTKILPKDMAPIFRLLVNHLNSAIFDTTRGKQKMKCFISIVDLVTGRIEMMNCGFARPRILRAGVFDDLLEEKAPSLGESATLEPKISQMQLKAGDVIVWSPHALGQRLGWKQHETEKKWLEQVERFEMASAKSAEKITQAFVQGVGKELEKLNDFSDDVTAVVLGVPANAYFVERQLTSVKLEVA